MDQTLVLNASYEPLRVVSWQKAITLLFKGKVEVLAHYDREIRGVTVRVKQPSVLRLLRHVHLKRAYAEVPFTRRNVYVLEKGKGVGGTWCHNRYPGCACDIPSALYSFSFDVKKDWSRPYAPQPEILAYMESLAKKHDLLSRVRFGCEVRAATWDEDRARWTLELTSGESVEAEVVVSALGMFNELVTPDIEGLDSFAGTCFHSARWDWDHDLTGEAVGVIGSAASEIGRAHV